MAAWGRARVGCSGWMYKDWRGVVYPEKLPQRAWFEYYATLFDTVEINNTFYRLPLASTVEKWAEQAPPGFEYAVKLGAFGSHRMQLRDAASWLPNHLDRVERLGAAIGPTLVQLPPKWKKDAERLDEFLSVAPTHLRWAVELREPSWADEHPWELTADWTYIRFHGPQALKRKYWGRYGEKRLEPVAERLEACLAEGRDVYAYFNNDYRGYAVKDAAWLAERLVPASADVHQE